jgi:hypothetical protein
LPRRSELYRWIEGVPGVSHVRHLNLTYDLEAARKFRHFLIFPEDPRITLSLPD